MGKLKRFTISLTNGGVFYAGTMLEGEVIVELSEPMKMRGIKLNFKGKAYVHWKERKTEGTGDSRRTYTKHYSSTERYFDDDVLLHGIWSGQGSTTTELPEGIHKFPFKFQLPNSLPSSFEHDIGHVRYYAKCNIDKPWKFDPECKSPFTIISILDLNQNPQYSQKMQGQEEKHLCCLCCKDGPISATFSLQRQGYVPGEAIKIFADIVNGASKPMAQSSVDLTMKMYFHADGETKKKTSEVASICRPEIAEHSEDSWRGEELVVPPLPPSHLIGCRIIDIKYILQFSVCPSGFSFDLTIPFEIIIGTIPLAQVVSDFPPMPPPAIGFAGFGEPSAPPAEIMYPVPPPTGIPNLPPPSYAECVTGKVDIREDGDNEHTQGNFSYVPVYTFYNFGHTPAGLPPQKSKDEDDDYDD